MSHIFVDFASHGSEALVVVRHETPLPLTVAQIEAAARLHEQHLPQWRAADAALEAVRSAFGSDFSYSANLVRVSTINTLYGTNLKAVHRMAQHIAGILPGATNWLDPIEVVEAIAALPAADGETPRRHRSFASKFCHFFIDADAFSILDQAARDALRLHLGSEADRQANSGYAGFCEALARLRQVWDLSTRPRDLDRYLWIAGMYLAFAKGRRDINRDLLALFDRSPRPPKLACIVRGLSRLKASPSRQPS